MRVQVLEQLMALCFHLCVESPRRRNTTQPFFGSSPAPSAVLFHRRAPWSTLTQIIPNLQPGLRVIRDGMTQKEEEIPTLTLTVKKYHSRQESTYNSTKAAFLRQIRGRVEVTKSIKRCFESVLDVSSIIYCKLPIHLCPESSTPYSQLRDIHFRQNAGL